MFVYKTHKSIASVRLAFGELVLETLLLQGARPLWVFKMDGNLTLTRLIGVSRCQVNFSYNKGS